MSFSIKQYKHLIFVSLFLIITFAIYFPGLSGDYVFDDPANILDNKKIAIDSLEYSDLKAAWGSGESGPLGRPISMLSFALNYYITGFNPFYFKLTNLIIHIINGILIYFLSFFLLNRISSPYYLSKKLIPYLAFIISTIWLVHPLNLTSVLYVVQRMTSLSTLFGFLMLLIYCYWRASTTSLIITLVSFGGMLLTFFASIFSKESGLLFLGLLYWIEVLIFQGKNLKGEDILVGRFKFIQLLWIGIVIGLFTIIYIALPYIHNPVTGNRDFNTVERLFTESRVIFYYLKMIFLPLLSDLSLYHDDFIISKSIIQPVTTIYSILGLVFISGLSLFYAKKYPLIIFAWGWYVISQLMESTFINLELIHEHRNYFGTIGFIILIVYSVTIINNQIIKKIMIILGMVYIFNLAFTTWQRSVIWSNLVDQAVYEAAMHPYSDRSNYQMARIYMKLMIEFPSKREGYARKAYHYLQQSKKSYLPSNGAWFAELHLFSEMKWNISSSMLNELKARLAYRSFTNNNIGFLSAFSDCQIKGLCHVPHDKAVQIIAAGIDNPNVNNNVRAELYKLLANYFVSVIADFPKGEEFMRYAVALHEDINGRLLFAQIYRLQGKYGQANAQLQRANQLDKHQTWYKEIAIEQRNLRQAEAK